MTHTLFYGDNGIHEFWQSDSKDSLLIFRNHSEKVWSAINKSKNGDSVIGDNKQNAKNPNGTWSSLCGGTSGELAKKIEIQEGIEIEFDYTKTYQGKERVKLIKKRPCKKVIKESSSSTLKEMSITKKQEIIQKWEKTAETANHLWKNQAQINASVIKKNSVKKAITILKKDYKKYGHMGIGSFIQSAINDLEELDN